MHMVSAQETEEGMSATQVQVKMDFLLPLLPPSINADHHMHGD